MLARLHAGWLLGWSLLLTLARRLFLPARQGLSLFHSNYDEDRLLPVSSEERLALPEFSRCVACGCCDSGQARAIASSKGAYRGMMASVLCASRSLPDFDAASLALQHVDAASLERLERLCPVRIPFRKLAAFVHAKAQAMR